MTQKTPHKTAPHKTIETDVVIVGAGAAGLFAALTLAAVKNTPRIAVISEKPLGGVCASAFAQGGIAAAVARDDSIEKHIADTIKAAAGTADPAAVRALVSAAPRYVDILARHGVRFERDANGDYRLSREACHSHRRVLKAAAGDGFGRELMRALAAAVAATPAIEVIDGVSAARILRRDGKGMGPVAGILAHRPDGTAVVVAAPAVLLATGGIGGLYAATTNPLHAVGRGLALAARAGAVLSDLEFVQFHPTALDIGEDPAPLATEALRGEGATLVNGRGERFMQTRHAAGELAPRDIVSRGIFAEIMRGQKTYLDCRHIDTSGFPALLAATARAGLDPRRDPVPVMPAVHYHMGGIATDLKGRSSIDGLWAAGECAATGLHGANRLASNSLMEAVVMAGFAADDIAARLAAGMIRATPDLSAIAAARLPAPPMAARDKIRRTMTDLVGVIRDGAGLQSAIDALTAIETGMNGVDDVTADMALVARLVAASALARTESRGGHCRADYPAAVESWKKRSFTTLKQIGQTVSPVHRHFETAA